MSIGFPGGHNIAAGYEETAGYELSSLGFFVYFRRYVILLLLVIPVPLVVANSVTWLNSLFDIQLL